MYDPTPPTSNVTSQTQGLRYSELLTISGTASDDDAGTVNDSGIADLSDEGIQFQIANSDDSKFY